MSSFSPTGSFGTEQQLLVTIPDMANQFKSILSDWAAKYGGVCFIAEDDQEKINIGFNNCVGPRVLIVFTGEEPYLSEDISDQVPWERRNWDILIQRGKVMSDPRNSSLTTANGPSKAFYALMEECRDVMRCIQLPQAVCYNPIEYKGIRPGQSELWLMDNYIMSFTTLVQIPRIQYQSPELTGIGGFVNLEPPGNWVPNSTYSPV